MQPDSQYFSGNPPYNPYSMGGYPYDSNAGANYNYGPPAASPFDTTLQHHEFPRPLNDVEFQPFDTCPKNFVIFDQTYSKSRVMFHPSLAQNFGSSSFNMYDDYVDDAGKGPYRDHEEDTEEIDALLYSEETECGDDDDVVSTGRTPGSWGGYSPESPCSYAEGISKSKASSGKNVVVETGNSDRKRDRMKKMMKTLKGIVPGGERMDTPAVLDEAVKYLKSLKVEVKKLGRRNSDG